MIESDLDLIGITVPEDRDRVLNAVRGSRILEKSNLQSCHTLHSQPPLPSRNLKYRTPPLLWPQNLQRLPPSTLMERQAKSLKETTFNFVQMDFNILIHQTNIKEERSEEKVTKFK